MTATRMICLYFGNPEECQNCGGWTKAEGGPFPADSRFCSEDCFEDAMEYAARMRERSASNYCQACGYDCGEHDPACTRVAVSTRNTTEGVQP